MIRNIRESSVTVQISRDDFDRMCRENSILQRLSRSDYIEIRDLFNIGYADFDVAVNDLWDGDDGYHDREWYANLLRKYTNSIKKSADSESLKESLNLNEAKNIINVLNKNLRVRFKHSAGGIFSLDRTPFNEDTFNKLIKNNYKMLGDILEEQGLKYDISEDAYISKDENLYVTIYGDTGTVIVQFDEMESESLKESVNSDIVSMIKKQFPKATVRTSVRKHSDVHKSNPDTPVGKTKYVDIRITPDKVSSVNSILQYCNHNIKKVLDSDNRFDYYGDVPARILRRTDDVFLSYQDYSGLSDDECNSLLGESLNESNNAVYDMYKNQYKNLLQDIKYVLNSDNIEDIRAYDKESQGEYILSKLFDSRMNKQNMSFEDAKEDVIDFLYRTRADAKSELELRNKRSLESKSIMNKVRSELSKDYKLVSESEDTLYFKAPGNSTHDDCIAFVDKVVAVSGGKYTSTGRGGSWTLWDILTPEGSYIKAGYDYSNEDNYAVYFKSILTESRSTNSVKSEAIDGWDNRTGVIKRIDKYLSSNPEAVPPKGYIARHTRAYDDIASRYGDYVTTSFSNISTNDLMQYARDNKLLDECKSIKESFPRTIDLDRVVDQVANLVDEKALGDDWIEVFPIRDAIQSASGEYFVRLEITGPDDVKKKATFRTRNGRVEVAFLNGSEAMCDSAESIARFIAGEFGLSIREQVTEGFDYELRDDLVKRWFDRDTADWLVQSDPAYAEWLAYGEALTTEDFMDAEKYAKEHLSKSTMKEAWQQLKTKEVIDSDGFVTEYSLWHNNDDDTYICIFGDSEMYTPDDSYPDAEFDTEQEAYEWFNSYEGFGED